MNREQRSLPEAELHALVDEELPATDRAGLLEQMRHDRRLSEAACELRNLKDMVKLAYRDVPATPQRAHGKGTQRWWPALAASLFLLVTGALAGWLLHPSAEPARFALLDPDGRGNRAASVADGEVRVVFHVTDPDMTVAADLLDEVEGLLRTYRAQQQPLRVEVVAHGEGLGLLRARLSQHPQRIAALASRYPNLTFVGCRNTMTRLQVEQGIEVVLLPEAKLTQSGVAHVVRRRQEGWAYIQV